MTQFPIRTARDSDFGLLREIEFAANQLFSSVGIGPFVNDDVEDHFDTAALVLVAGEPPVGFVCVDLVDENPHIWQLSVHPDRARQGIGRSLMEAVFVWVKTEGHVTVTLTTYRDVLWNGPFYESLGFESVNPISPELNAMREHERDIGDDAFGPRVAMRRSMT